MSAITTQIGGDHYKSLAIQPVEYITRNGLGFIEGSVIKYVTRHKAKGGAEDIKKAIHFLNLLLELEYGGENLSDQCQALFSHIETDANGMRLAFFRDHGKCTHAASRGVIIDWAKNVKCETCKAVMLLALAELTKP